LQEVIASQAKSPRIRLKELIEPRYEKVKKDDYDGGLPIVAKISFADGKLHFRDERETGMDLYRARKGDLVTSKINIHQGALALSPCDLVASTHYLHYKVRTTDVHPLFLVSLLRTPQFAALLNDQKNKGIKNEQGAEFLTEFQIPLPTMKEQEDFAAFIERQSNVIAGAELLLEHYEVHLTGLSDYEPQPLATVVGDIQNGLYKPGSDYGAGTPILRIDDFATGDVIGETGELKLVRTTKTEASRFALRPGDIVLNRVNSLEHVGKVALVGELPGPAVYESNMMRLRVDTERVLPAFVFRLLASPAIAQQLKAKAKQAVNQFSVNQGDVGEVLIPIPPREVQERIVREIELELVTLQHLSEISKHAKAVITQTLDRIWET